MRRQTGPNLRLSWSILCVALVALTCTVMALAAAALIAAARLKPTASAAPAAEIKDGEQLLRAMHDRYAKDWYDTLSFQQDAITHNEDGTTKTEVWYEAAVLPGKLRIDIANDQKDTLQQGQSKQTAQANVGKSLPKPDDSHGMLVADNSITIFKNGAMTAQRPFVHMLLVLGFDVYKQPAETTIATVKAEGYDLSKLHEENFLGEPMYVVGVDKDDLKTKQFWVEKKRLLFVRLLKPDDQDATKTDDERFLDYKKLPVGWVAARVEFYKDGKMQFHEVYANIKANPKLDPAKFDPKSFKSAQ